MAHYLEMVKIALSTGKIYKVIGAASLGQVRIELHKRGFIETVSNNWQNDLYQLPEEELLRLAENGNEHERVLLTKLLGEQEPTFLWINRTNSYSIYQHMAVMNKINIMYGNFVTKDGLCQCIERIRNCGLNPPPEVLHPRSYIVSNDNNFYKKFYADYKLTIATSVVMFLSSKKDVSSFFTEAGTLPLKALDFAFQVIIVYSQQKEDDCTLMNTEYQDGIEWRLLANAHTALVHYGEKFKMDDDWMSEWVTDLDHNQSNKTRNRLSMRSKLQTYLQGVEFMTKKIVETWPWRKADGYSNIWVLKPARTGEGQGIILTDDAEKVKEHIQKYKYKPYILQKYIERPLLVYGTKFDIRQYFLITIDSNYLRAWSHPICTVKFASKPFSLDDFSEAIHITNTAVQYKYQETSHPNLPKHHMWSIGALILYLNSIDKGHLWNSYVYPKIKTTLQNITLASIDNIELMPGRFELFGCDWIITNDFKPYLLEINRCPSLEYYSPVSRIVCGNITEDLIKGEFDMKSVFYLFFITVVFCKILWRYVKNSLFSCVNVSSL